MAALRSLQLRKFQELVHYLVYGDAPYTEAVFDFACDGVVGGSSKFDVCGGEASFLTVSTFHCCEPFFLFVCVFGVMVFLKKKSSLCACVYVCMYVCVCVLVWCFLGCSLWWNRQYVLRLCWNRKWNRENGRLWRFVDYDIIFFIFVCAQANDWLIIYREFGISLRWPRQILQLFLRRGTRQVISIASHTHTHPHIHIHTSISHLSNLLFIYKQNCKNKTYGLAADLLLICAAFVVETPPNAWVATGSRCRALFLIAVAFAVAMGHPVLLMMPSTKSKVSFASISFL